MQVYVAVLGFQGVVHDVSVHHTRDAAMREVEDHIAGSGLSVERWFELLELTNDYPRDDYEPTNIYICELT
jgi:hypothetical protein